MLTRIRLYTLARVLFPCHHSLVLICLWLPWLRWLKFHLVFPCFFKAYGFPPKLKTEVAKMVGCMLFATLFSESYTHMEKSNGHLVVFHQKFFPLTLLIFQEISSCPDLILIVRLTERNFRKIEDLAPLYKHRCTNNTICEYCVWDAID